MAKLNKGLGKGLESLIPTDFDTALLMQSSERIQNILIKNIAPNPNQPRRFFNEESLKELASSIEQFGVLQPLIVTPTNNNEYKIIAGERRWRAANIAGLKSVPALVRKEEELAQLEIALIENVQREDLSPLEQAVSIERLHQQFNMPYSRIAEKLSKAVPTLNNIVRLLQLPSFAIAALRDMKITEGHARAILALKGFESKQAELLSLIIKNSWSVRQAEQFVQSHKKGLNTEKAVMSHMASETPDTRILSKNFKVPVKVYRTASGGRLELHFKSDLELSRLIKSLKTVK